MSLKRVSLISVVSQQYRYKLKAYIGVFTSLVIIQLLGVLISLNGFGIGGHSNESFSVNITTYSSNLVISFTMVWGFINAILLTTKAYREDDFTFVTNRLSHNLSNIAFLITASVVGAITAVLSGSIIKLIAYYTNDIEVYISFNQVLGIKEYGLGLLTTILFIVLSCAFGYLVGMVGQLNKLFLILIPVLFVALTIPVQRNGENGLSKLFEFYLQEHSLLVFILKVVLSVVLLYLAAIAMSNRMEVRKW